MDDNIYADESEVLTTVGARCHGHGAVEPWIKAVTQIASLVATWRLMG